MIIATLLDDVTTDTDNPANRALIANNDAIENGIVQVSITGGGAVVNLMGRVNATMPWVLVAQYLESKAERLALYPQMYAKAFNVVDATVRVALRG